MAKKKKPDYSADREAIESILQGALTPDKLQRFLKKDQTFSFRLSRYDKETLAETATQCDMTVTEYLMKLHYLAMDALKKSR